MNNASTNSLWASAFVLMACILFIANKHSQYAIAEGSIENNGFTMVTTQGGQGTDLLYVIDDQRAVLMIYNLPNPQNESYIHPVASWNLALLFNSVRQ